MNVAASVRRMKEENPQHFCAKKECLWRVLHRDGRITPCPKHPVVQSNVERAS